MDGQAGAAPLEGAATSSMERLSTEDDVLRNCKEQLSGLVNALHQLEAYSSGCARSSRMDNALYQHLVEQMVQARSIMEMSLSNVVEHVGAENSEQSGLVN